MKEEKRAEKKREVAAKRRKEGAPSPKTSYRQPSLLPNEALSSLDQGIPCFIIKEDYHHPKDQPSCSRRKKWVEIRNIPSTLERYSGQTKPSLAKPPPPPSSPHCREQNTAESICQRAPSMPKTRKSWGGGLVHVLKKERRRRRRKERSRNGRRKEGAPRQSSTSSEPLAHWYRHWSAPDRTQPRTTTRQGQRRQI